MKPSLQEKIALFIFHNDDNIVLAFKLVGIVILFSLTVLMIWFGLFYDVGSEFLCQFLLPILAVLEVVSLLLFLGMFSLMVWSLLVESGPNFMWTIYGVLAGFIFLQLQRRIPWQSKRLLRCRRTNFAKFVLRLRPQLQPRKQSPENNGNPKNKPQLSEEIDNVEPSPAFYCVPCGDLVFADRRSQISLSPR